MKNNNLSLKNNSNVSFMTKHRNKIVIAIIVVFLIIVGVLIYRNSFSDDVDFNLENSINLRLPPHPSLLNN